VIGRDWLSTRAGYGILLVAMAIQGITPDYVNLASPWLLKLVISVSADDPAEGDPSPSPAPLDRNDGEGVPGEFCSKATAESALRVNLDTGGRLCVRYLPSALLDSPGRSATRSLHPHGVVQPGFDGSIPSLCRFQC
jgi:hypothetical protein